MGNQISFYFLKKLGKKNQYNKEIEPTFLTNGNFKFKNNGKQGAINEQQLKKNESN